MAFADLKKKSGSFANLTKEIEKMSSGGKKVDERFWKPQVDKSGNGFAVIRFLPESEGADLPWAQVWSHAFQGPGGWYIENSLTTLGQKDPVSALNSSLWNSGNESDKDIARKQKRKLSYYSNIYVVKDPLNPENEGKVFLYKYGKRIFDKIMAKMQPNENDYDPEPAFNPFDLWKGADFKLKIRKVDGYWNYDKSEFAQPNTLGDFDDDRLEQIWKEGYSLAEFEDSKNFKSYDALKARLDLVLKSQARVAPSLDESLEDETEGRGTPRDWGAEVTEFRQKSAVAAPAAEETDTLSYFQSLAEED
jgi:hypothetical protein